VTDFIFLQKTGKQGKLVELFCEEVDPDVCWEPGRLTINLSASTASSMPKGRANSATLNLLLFDGERMYTVAELDSTGRLSILNLLETASNVLFNATEKTNLYEQITLFIPNPMEGRRSVGMEKNERKSVGVGHPARLSYGRILDDESKSTFSSYPSWANRAALVVAILS